MDIHEVSLSKASLDKNSDINFNDLLNNVRTIKNVYTEPGRIICKYNIKYNYVIPCGEKNKKRYRIKLFHSRLSFRENTVWTFIKYTKNMANPGLWN